MSSVEQDARQLIRMMEDAGTAPGQLMNFGAIEWIWLRPDRSDRDALVAALQYAGDPGWMDNAGGHELRLTSKGAAA